VRIDLDPERELRGIAREEMPKNLVGSDFAHGAGRVVVRRAHAARTSPVELQNEARVESKACGRRIFSAACARRRAVGDGLRTGYCGVCRRFGLLGE
jgi:hypothetical protein